MRNKLYMLHKKTTSPAALLTSFALAAVFFLASLLSFSPTVSIVDAQQSIQCNSVQVKPLQVEIVVGGSTKKLFDSQRACIEGTALGIGLLPLPNLGDICNRQLGCVCLNPENLGLVINNNQSCGSTTNTCSQAVEGQCFNNQVCEKLGGGMGGETYGLKSTCGALTIGANCSYDNQCSSSKCDPVSDTCQTLTGQATCPGGAQCVPSQYPLSNSFRCINTGASAEELKCCPAGATINQQLNKCECPTGTTYNSSTQTCLANTVVDNSTWNPFTPPSTTYGSNGGKQCTYACYACDNRFGPCNTGKVNPETGAPASGFIDGTLPNAGRLNELVNGCGTVQCDCVNTFSNGVYNGDAEGFSSAYFTYACSGSTTSGRDYICKDANGDGKNECVYAQIFGTGQLTMAQCSETCNPATPVFEPPAPNIPPQEVPPQTPSYQCNSTCENSDQCKTANSSLICATDQGNRCRLESNPGSESCQPAVGPMCLDVSLTNVSTANNTTDPKLGEAIQITCGDVAAITQSGKYVARIVEPTGNIVALTMTGRVSNNYVINQSGRHYAQCQICTTQDDNSCYPYEPIQ